MREYEFILNEQSRASLFHGIKLEHAFTALKNNQLEGRSSQRAWKDGLRRIDKGTKPGEDKEYNNSFWLKGLSLTRDKTFAQNWAGVVFELNQDLLKQKYKIIPYNWMYSINKSVSRKKEREEFLVTGIIKSNLMNRLYSDEDLKGMENDPDYEKLKNDFRFDATTLRDATGYVKNLHKYLISISIGEHIIEIYGKDDPKIQFIMNYPKFIGIFEDDVHKEKKKKASEKVG